ncbi:MAG: hypothetical protein Q7S29_03245 [Candidatus Peribacter sp.]|nr:hypothetical protein [Candidatus Peribacter sp.]
MAAPRDRELGRKAIFGEFRTPRPTSNRFSLRLPAGRQAASDFTWWVVQESNL